MTLGHTTSMNTPVMTIRCLSAINRFVWRVIPVARRELAVWRRSACCAPEPARKEALSSIASKSFHCIGGSFYAVMGWGWERELCRAIVAFQTISDYLDNLCDRMGQSDVRAFARAHESMIDAVRLTVKPSAYYLSQFDRDVIDDDGGYLAELVKTCGDSLRMLPSYPVVMPAVVALAVLYSEMQSYKHGRDREQALIGWYGRSYPGRLVRFGDQWPDVTWNEFAAGCGSTICMFALWALAARPGVTGDEVNRCVQAYFPFITAAHIMFDYLIDQEEDRIHGCLNFVASYNDVNWRQRLPELYGEAIQRAAGLPDPHLHVAAVAGLAAVYLSDPKSRLLARSDIDHFLSRGGPTTRIASHACRLFRRTGALSVTGPG